MAEHIHGGGATDQEIGQRQEADRRIDTRCGMRLEADVTLPGDLTIVGHTMDLSAGGISIEVPYMLEFGQECMIELDLSALGGPSWLQLTAEVRHCRQLDGEQFIAGLRFIDPDPVMSELLSSLS